MKFTIADKHEAQEILKSNSSLSQEDKEIIEKKPVFSVLKTLFEKYYDLELLSVYESATPFLALSTKPIEKYFPNPEESYVSMVSSNDHLVYGETSTPTERPEKKEFKNEEEVREIELHSEIENYVNEHIPQRTKFLIQYTAWSSYSTGVYICLSHPKDCDEQNFYVEVEAGSELEAVNKHFNEQWGIGNYYERPLLSQEELDTLLEKGYSMDIDMSDPWIEDFSVTKIYGYKLGNIADIKLEGAEILTVDGVKVYFFVEDPEEK